MASLHIVVDSTANLPEQILREQPNLHVVALKVRLGEREWTDGRVTVLDKVRTRGRAVLRMLEELKKETKPAYVGIVHIEAGTEARDLDSRVRELFPGIPVSVSGTGSVLGAHLGPGLIGMIFQPQPQRAE